MNKRIREARTSLGLTQKEFSKRIGVSQNSVSHIEKEGSPIKEQTVKAICAEFCVNEQWLRTGSGEMFRETEKREKEFLGYYEKLDPCLQDFLIKTAQNLLDAEARMKKGDS